MTAVPGRSAHDDTCLLMMRAVAHCDHAHAVDTLAPGIRYCHRCDHWLGTREAFARLPAAAQTERERCIYTDGADARRIIEAEDAGGAERWRS